MRKFIGVNGGCGSRLCRGWETGNQYSACSGLLSWSFIWNADELPGEKLAITTRNGLTFRQMETQNPYAPPALPPVKDPVYPDDLDLSKLTPQQRKILEVVYTKPSLSWRFALILAAVSAVAFINTYVSGNMTGVIAACFFIKIFGYVGLGYWARTWSRLAALFLIVWHLISPKFDHASYRCHFVQGWWRRFTPMRSFSKSSGVYS